VSARLSREWNRRPYTEKMACAICETRRPKRFCPGVGGDICTICCGTEREVTVTCPLDCEFLLEARRHDKPRPLKPEELPNRDIRVPEAFLQDHEGLLAFLGQAVAQAAFATPGAADLDVRDALDALIRTYRTLDSGVYYDTLPQGAVAANVYRVVQQGIGKFREAERQRFGASRTRDADILRLLVFLQRLELTQSNGRSRGRAFLGALQGFYAGSASEPSPAPPSSLILP
jgi:hypothetical protein